MTPHAKASHSLARRMRRAATLLLLVSAMAVGASVTGGAQSGPPPEARPTWPTIVAAYVSGRHVDAVVMAGAVDAADLVIEGRKHLDRWRDDTTDEAHRSLKASAALGFELALVHLNGDDRTRSDRYMGFGADALRSLERSRSASPVFTAHWRLAGLHYLLLSRQHGELERQARRDDVNLLPPSLQAEWYVARGIAHETSARLSGNAPRVQQTTFGTAAFNRALWIEREQDVALGHYREALAADPAHVETRVRLGRVLLERGKTDEARQHLQQVATDRCAGAACGLAWLFLGELHAEHGALNDSRRAYLRASRVLDIRQSALIGLLRVTLQEKPVAALEMTRQFDAEAMLGLQQTPDAWSRYLAGNPLGLPAVITALREEAVK